ncbi:MULTISPECIES: HlyD family efflux transporter periplasmic adaptor subunit [unclassified Bartonella]|uniref:HlyD family efflux transporter periplasmic adaptor subunit n=2 Tax=unclassified Bartonella TaxID=2645622 RepID=UPI0015FE1793|nr:MULTISPECIES: HlyD family efflux transporter periplasmic adaptor subunit [unclassified Bartonella]UXM94099.1 HlyD family efflux transporter periplasmic adaptor subunit [Bartonella sp. HY329]UXN04399.1 HlyD family efflux transporter periplasmic adaptor subunit [Bartonella sp. HY406]UXN08421.1 HlyD family efflux transporter periplasmic adaptor subunit [Bartonella sp. HY328]
MFSDGMFKIYGVTNKARIMLWIMMTALAAFLVWACLFELQEVAVGEGRVIPSMKGQIVQNLEGGIIENLTVKEGDTVKKGDVLATLDMKLSQAKFDETSSKIITLQARAARIEAEINDADKIDFPADVLKFKEVTQRETNLFTVNRRAFKENISNIQNQLNLAEEQIKIAQPLMQSGAASKTELLRLQQIVAELTTSLGASQNQYLVALRDDYTKTMSELEPLIKSLGGLKDQLSRRVITSPTEGIVKNVNVSTIGGVIAPGGILMEIVPQDDQLVIEAKITPRDIAFIHDGQSANVKISAYDSGVYGSMKGKVIYISPDTIEDEADKRVRYYRVHVQTDQSYIDVKDKNHPEKDHKYSIFPGMVATTEISTGQKTIIAYLLKPLNRAGEALRER